MGLETMNVANNILLLVLLLSSSGCQRSEVPANEFDKSFLELGQEIVETHCAACHTASASGESPRADAPALRNVLEDYNPNALADDFREHIHVGHPDMPDYDFTVKETEGLLAYLWSIQEAQE